MLAYTPDTDAVNADVDFCLSLLPPEKLNLTLNLGLPVSPTFAHVQSKIDYARKQGITRFSFFNYGFLGKVRLAWLKQLS
jgi:hypothetical protein